MRFDTIPQGSPKQISEIRAQLATRKELAAMPCSICWRSALIQSLGRRWRNRRCVVHQDLVASVLLPDSCSLLRPPSSSWGTSVSDAQYPAAPPVTWCGRRDVTIRRLVTDRAEALANGDDKQSIAASAQMGGPKCCLAAAIVCLYPPAYPDAHSSVAGELVSSPRS